MEEIIKQLLPVCVEAIKTGKVLGIWYIVAFSIVPLIKTIINWTFVLVILKGLYALVKKGMDK